MLCFAAALQSGRDMFRKDDLNGTIRLGMSWQHYSESGLGIFRVDKQH